MTKKNGWKNEAGIEEIVGKGKIKKGRKDLALMHTTTVHLIYSVYIVPLCKTFFNQPLKALDITIQ